jgi:hypothetical protein
MQIFPNSISRHDFVQSSHHLLYRRTRDKNYLTPLVSRLYNTSDYEKNLSTISIHLNL